MGKAPAEAPEKKTSPEAKEAKPAAPRRGKKPDRPPGGTRKWMALAFLGPALVFLGALVVYPSIDTVLQSFQANEAGYPWQRSFVGFDHYRAMVESPRIVTAIRNNAIWVATAPAIITGLGLMFAILTERVKYATAVKVIVFMPMAISFLATGVIWRLMYEEDRNRGLINAAIGTASDVVSPEGRFSGANVLPASELEPGPQGGFVTKGQVEAGEVAPLALTAILEEEVPEDATQAEAPEVGPNDVGVVVWRDFKPGGGEVGVVEEGELGLPGVEVQLLDAQGNVVETGTTEPDGSLIINDVSGGPFTVRLTPVNFTSGFEGVNWLGPDLVTPAIIGAFSWMWAGFAVVVIGAGLAALPRDVLEAARVDGANEWQTFRHVTLPLLAPVLGVVFVTLLINVLKIFDIVFVMAAGAVQNEANVIALEMYRTAFGARNFGVGSAIAVLLFVLVIPIMLLNVKRFRRET